MKFFDRANIEKLRRGYYSAVYFNRTKDILLSDKKLENVTMQVFQKNEGSILCGVEEVAQLLKIGVGYWKSQNSEFGLPALPDRQAGGKAGIRNSEWIDKSGTLEVSTL